MKNKPLLLPVVVALVIQAALLFLVPQAHGQGANVRVNQLGKTVDDGRVVMVTNGVPTTVFTNYPAVLDGKILIRRVQNMGTGPVFVGLGTTNVTTNSFHAVLAGGTAFNNGTGGDLDISYWSGVVSMISQTSTNNVATIQVRQ